MYLRTLPCPQSPKNFTILARVEKVGLGLLFVGIALFYSPYRRYESLKKYAKVTAGQLEEQSKANKKKDEMIEKLKKQLQEQPKIVYRDVEPKQRIEPPVLVGLRFTQNRLESTNPELPYGLRVVIQTDQRLEPVRLAVICDGEIGAGRESYGVTIHHSSRIVGERRNIFFFSWQAPAFVPDRPIIVTLFSRMAIKVTKIEVVSGG